MRRKMERALLIYNPTSGKEKTTSKVNLAAFLLSGAGMELDVYATRGPGDAEIAAARASGSYDIIIAAGGDGTLNEIVNGMGTKSKTKLGIIPSGTSNDFARALGIPTGVRAACQIILSGKVKQVDLGNLNGRLFINIAGGGNLTNISYEVPSKLKTYLGQMAYYAKSLEEIPRLRPVKMCLKTPEAVLEDDFMLFLTANSKAVGGFPQLAPKASISDGLLDLIAVKAINIAEFIQLAARTLNGEHLNHPKIIYLQTPFVEVTSDEDISLNVDGEYAGKLPCTISVHSQPLSILTPT